LRAARIAAGHTLQSAGEMIGVSKAHYGKIERGLNRLDVARAVQIARLLGVSVESFL